MRWNKRRVQLKISWEPLLQALPKGLWMFANRCHPPHQNSMLFFTGYSSCHVCFLSVITLILPCQRICPVRSVDRQYVCDYLLVYVVQSEAGRTTLQKFSLPDSLRLVKGRSESGQRWKVMRSQRMLWGLQKPKHWMTSRCSIRTEIEMCIPSSVFFLFEANLLTCVLSTNQFNSRC